MAKFFINFLLILSLIFSLFACLPSKKEGITLEGKTTAPRGYTEMQIRDAVDKAVKE
jgi:hypothetical protein